MIALNTAVTGMVSQKRKCTTESSDEYLKSPPAPNCRSANSHITFAFSKASVIQSKMN